MRISKIYNILVKVGHGSDLDITFKLRPINFCEIIPRPDILESENFRLE